MTRMLIVLTLALGPAPAFATPTLELAGDEFRPWKGAEVTVYQSTRPNVSRADTRDDPNAYPFNP